MKKVMSLAKVLELVQRAKKAGKIIVTTNGCFDILHVGHVQYLTEAKALGDILIIGMNSDASVRRNKGPLRPIVPERERAQLLAALEAVDAVFIFDDKTPMPWLSKIKPHVHVKGGDYANIDKMIERETVEKGGGRVALARLAKNKSTTKVIAKIVKAYGSHTNSSRGRAGR